MTLVFATALVVTPVSGPIGTVYDINARPYAEQSRDRQPAVLRLSGEPDVE